jgi:hypothetical protein
MARKTASRSNKCCAYYELGYREDLRVAITDSKLYLFLFILGPAQQCRKHPKTVLLKYIQQLVRILWSPKKKPVITKEGLNGHAWLKHKKTRIPLIPQKCTPNPYRAAINWVAFVFGWLCLDSNPGHLVRAPDNPIRACWVLFSCFLNYLQEKWVNMSNTVFNL